MTDSSHNGDTDTNNDQMNVDSRTSSETRAPAARKNGSDNNKLFVGSLPFESNDDDLKEFFETVGTVVSAKVINDRETGKSRGFGFVEMSSKEEASKAIETLNGKSMGKRNITVSEATKKEEGGGFKRREGSGFGPGPGFGAHKRGGREGGGGGRDGGGRDGGGRSRW